MKRNTIIFAVLVTVLIVVAVGKVYAVKEPATKGVTSESKDRWSYNRKTHTMTISKNKSKKQKKCNSKGFRYWGKKTKKLVIKNGVNKLDTPNINKLDKLIIPGSIKRIAPEELAGLFYIKDIEFKNGLEYISYEAFKNQYGLNNIQLPQSLKCIGKRGFAGTKARKIRLNAGLEYIGDFAFAWSEVESVSIPDSVEYVGDYAFNDCSMLKDIQLPKHIKTIRYNMLSETPCLVTCNIPESVICIQSEAFAKSGIEEITIPRNVKLLGGAKYEDVNDMGTQGIFNECNNLKKIRIISKKIEKVFPNAMSGINSDTIIEVPCELLDEYSQMFVDAGLPSNVKIVGIDVDDSEFDAVCLNKLDLAIKSGASRKLELLYSDESEYVEWQTSDNAVISVDSSGNAKALNVGEAIITASYKGREYVCNVRVTCSDADNDEKELKKLIKDMRKRGCKCSKDIYGKQYGWRDGRLISIDWRNCDMCGVVDLNPFTYLESFSCGDNDKIYDEAYVGWCSMWKIDANDLTHLKYIETIHGALPNDSIFFENSKQAVYYGQDYLAEE